MNRRPYFADEYQDQQAREDRRISEQRSEQYPQASRELQTAKPEPETSLADVAVLGAMFGIGLGLVYFCC
jgi:hypothetical protein